jgi:allantoin racemase
VTATEGGRLWCQGLVPLTDESQAYFDARARHAMALPFGQTTIEFHSLPSTFFPHGVTPADMARTDAGELLYELLIADAAMTAEAEGYTAFAIGVVQDSGLRLARSVTDFPVVGYGQAAALLGRSLGSRIGVIAFNPDLFPLISQRLNEHVPDIVVAIEDIGMPYADVLRSFTEPKAAAALRERLFIAANRLQDAGADILVPGQMLLSEAVSHIGVTQVNGVTLIDGLAATIALARSMMALHRPDTKAHEAAKMSRPEQSIRNLIAKCAKALRQS